MNITKEETIRALLDSEKVEHVAVSISPKGTTTSGAAMCVSDKNELDDFIAQYGSNITDFKVNLVPITEFNEGDIVFAKNRLAIFDSYDGEGCAMVIEDGSEIGFSYVSLDELILIKKGELNND